MEEPNNFHKDVENNRSPLEGAIFWHLRAYYPNERDEEEKDYREGSD